MPPQEPKRLEKTFVVADQEAVHFMGKDVIPVLSTPALVNMMELTSRDNVGELLNVGEDTVGLSVQIRHLAPTPLGMKVRVVSTLRRIEERTYTFDVEAFDEVEKVAEATHERVVIRVAKFADRVASKKQKGASELTQPDASRGPRHENH